MGFFHKSWLKKTLGTTLAAASVLTMLPAFAGAAKEPAITTANVNLRKDATTSSASQGIIAKGTMITILDHEGKWYEVKVNGKTGYIRSDYVEEMDTNRVIKEGVKGDDVTYLQTALKELGIYSGEITGNAGPKTIAAVKTFQNKYDLKADGKVGAATWAKLQSVAGSSSGSTSSSSLKEGSEGDKVKEVQRKLKSTGFLTGSVDGKFGPQTTKAVKAFQKKYSFTVDGIVGPVTLKKLNELTSEGNSTAKTVLRLGATGSEVKELQKALKELGYYKKSVDGEFGQGTLAAVKAFQVKNKLTADGIAGSATLGKLYGSSAVSAGTSTTSTESSSTKTSSTAKKPSAGDVQLMEWSKVKKEIESREIITVYDVKSGKTYKVRQLASGNHCDVEPLTAEDTAIMKEINGGKFTWSPRPVWVTFDGITIACSIHSMPHDVSTIKDNNFNGHVCMHFLGSKTHNGNAAYTQDHQNAVQESWKLANK